MIQPSNLILTTYRPAGAIASLPKAASLPTGVGVALGVSVFIFTAVFLVLAILWFRRKRRRTAVYDEDSWANSSVRPEVVRGQSAEALAQNPLLQTSAAPRIPSTVIPPPSPADPFLSPEERAALVPAAPTVEMHQTESVLPVRAPSRMGFHGPTDGDGGATVAAKIRSASGNGNESAFKKSNKSSWRVSADLTPPIEVPEEMIQERPENDLDPLAPASPPNVRMTGRARSQSAGDRPDGQGEDLPESLGRLNRWLEDNRRRSRI